MRGRRPSTSAQTALTTSATGVSARWPMPSTTVATPSPITISVNCPNRSGRCESFGAVSVWRRPAKSGVPMSTASPIPQRTTRAGSRHERGNRPDRRRQGEAARKAIGERARLRHRPARAQVLDDQDGPDDRIGEREAARRRAEPVAHTERERGDSAHLDHRQAAINEIIGGDETGGIEGRADPGPPDGQKERDEGEQGWRR